MIRALIFDVDGTLAETEELHRRAFNETFAAHDLGWEWSVETYRRLLRTTGGKERMQAWQDSARLSRRVTTEEIASLHVEKTARYRFLIEAGGLALRPGVADLVAAAQSAGLRLAVASTTTAANVDTLTRSCWGQPAQDMFGVIAAGDVVQAKKPAPDVYLMALAQLGISAAEALAFEDSQAGLMAAQAAGLRVVVTPGVYTAGDDLAAADWLLPSLERVHWPEELRRVLAPGPPPARH